MADQYSVELEIIVKFNHKASTDTSTMPARIRVLNVAEKPSVAKELAAILGPAPGVCTILYYILLQPHQGRVVTPSFSSIFIAAPQPCLSGHCVCVASQRPGVSNSNRVYDFQSNLNGQDCDMRMTSVIGHLTEMDFVGGSRCVAVHHISLAPHAQTILYSLALTLCTLQYWRSNWHSTPYESLFDAEVEVTVAENCKDVVKNLHREARGCQVTQQSTVLTNTSTCHTH